ncbi:cobalamin biosynthesis protein [Rheinheimera sp. UJ51]|uniref:cobalamin biosynthesis protein CobD/CbiB n=1 Tax=Rheinheimera sp. UJ51 TaxID=2892446 RepID=UPI001E298D1F|nr:cobalamin biosynthesis protein [Rheinheimera sp. UJ51]MCC5452507.1 cobalamin biosynthesis protein [Rheinheimera sp. UJ51]
MANEFALSLIILVAALLLARLLPIPLIYHPLSFYAAFCRALARKVHPDPTRASSQQRLSGGLALFVAVSIPLALLVGLYLLASWPPLIDVIVLLCCLNWQPYVRQTEKIIISLEKSLLSLAKTQARLLLLRDTAQLSQMGLVKALLESLCLRFSQQIIAIMFWYLLAGAAGVLCYRLSQIASQQWSVKLEQYQHFGLAAAQVQQWLNLLPYWLSTALYWLQRHSRRAPTLLASKGAPMPKAKLRLLTRLSQTLQVSLAGPLYYRKQRVDRARLQQAYEPDIADLRRILRLQQHQFNLLLLCFTAIAGLILFFNFG